MHRTSLRFLGLTILVLATAPTQYAADLPYVVMDTGQNQCFDDHRRIAPPPRGAAFAGQDAQVKGPVPLYRDHHDGTISDETTGLMWTRELTRKLTWDEAMASPGSIAVGGHHDWRMPTIKELYSLIRFTGTDPDPRSASIAARTRPLG